MKNEMWSFVKSHTLPDGRVQCKFINIFGDVCFVTPARIGGGYILSCATEKYLRGPWRQQAIDAYKEEMTGVAV